MSKEFRYFGFHNPLEKYANNDDYYQSVLAKAGPFVEDRETKTARQILTFSKKFPSNLGHSRTVGHKVKIARLDNPTWKKSGTLVFPLGVEEVINEWDLALEVKKACQEDLEPAEVLEENVTIFLPDDTRIVGAKFREKHQGFDYQKKLDIPNLEIEYNMSRFAKTGEFDYRFNLSRSVSPENPIEIYISQTVEVDGTLVEEKSETAKPYFRSVNLNPTSFHHFNYRSVGKRVLI